ncbi:DUF1638 domain-containing protein [Desulfonatronospira sp.]|uniref:DUF1638 domain-containing protein n=1 Tax=Desulfonatronospira sp. TaxID=1962951 RepID=UPI0025C3F4E0|nr:DUF1638 domain-containing protein [Desulfonatronospira sp.]
MLKGEDTGEDTGVESRSPRVVIACGALRPELEHLRLGHENEVHTVYLPQNMHRSPHLLPDLIQEQVDTAAEYASRIILGYGLCSNGIVGVKAPEQGLVITRSHDCVALFLGSLEKFRLTSRDHPGTYYLTRGWIAEGKDPLGTMENDYVPRLGRAWAEWGAREEIKHYTRFVFINTGVGDIQALRNRAMENARFFGKEYLEVQGDLEYLRRILFGPYDRDYFYLVPPFEKVQQRWYVLEAAEPGQEKIVSV